MGGALKFKGRDPLYVDISGMKKTLKAALKATPVVLSYPPFFFSFSE